MLQEALVDQSQVYLPINNALSSVGHVHGFIQELGQARTLNAIRLHTVASGCNGAEALVAEVLCVRRTFHSL